MISPATLTAFAILALACGSLLGLARAGSDIATLATLGPYLTRLIASASMQAALSALLSLLLGIALALALLRRRFRGRDLLLALLTTAAVAPTIVIAFGIVAIYGRSGLLGELARGIGAEPPSIYGLHGIVIAHVVMNMPLVARALLHAFEREPGERSRLASALGFSATDCFRHLDWPVIRREAPALGVLVFLLCFTSFAIVLSLGGGPANATLEVAIFEAVRFEADFMRAAALAGLQLLICLGLAAILTALTPRARDEASAERHARRPDLRALRGFDGCVLALALALIAPPLLSVAGGLGAVATLASAEFFQAAATSALIAISAGLFACLLALLLASGARRVSQRSRLPDLAAFAMLGLPPFAFVAGLYVLLRGLADPASLGLFLVPLVNALMALPYAYRLLAPALATSASRHGRLAESLGISGWDRLRLVEWPALRGALGAAFAFATALSLGDFGVIALFGGPELTTLPYLLANRLGAYRIDEAGALALVLVLSAGSLAFLTQRWSARHA
ncbi:ABC transporter permease subunit [Bosea sp. (in: a-proteobacteria)]|uniref:ABC transporter permease subunit n=1 Tax=Bosea sp. (in: a-proteobacteria) TaxID=1871050 RepID=UPI002FC8E4C1